MLTIQRDGERHASLDDIGLGSLAGDVVIAVDLGLHRLSTERAEGVLSEVLEVVSPHVDCSSTVLGSLLRLDCLDVTVLVEIKLCGTLHIFEVSGQRDGELHRL